MSVLQPRHSLVALVAINAADGIAVLLSDNQPMLALCRELGCQLLPVEGGSIEARWTLK